MLYNNVIKSRLLYWIADHRWLKMADIQQWVEDRLHDVLGISEKYLAEYLIVKAQSSSNPMDFVTHLIETKTVAVDDKMKKFAFELFNKVS